MRVISVINYSPQNACSGLGMQAADWPSAVRLAPRHPAETIDLITIMGHESDL